MQSSTERLTPEKVLIVTAGAKVHRWVPVHSTIAHPPGDHPDNCPLVKDCMAVEMKTKHGSRWWGFTKAWIGSDLRMHVDGLSTGCEEVQSWAKPEETMV